MKILRDLDSTFNEKQMTDNYDGDQRVTEASSSASFLRHFVFLRHSDVTVTQSVLHRVAIFTFVSTQQPGRGSPLFRDLKLLLFVLFEAFASH